MEIMERLAPRRLAEEWDNPGLLLGSPFQPVKKIIVCLDVSDGVADMAVREQVDLIITHHPLIFKPLKKICTDQPLGRRLQKLLANDIAVYAAHTNLDSATGGVNDVLAKAIGLIKIKPFADSKGLEEEETLGRIGYLPTTLSADEFAITVREALKAKYVRLIKAGDKPIKKVALCGGSGAEFIAKAAFLGADAYVTGDVRYHDAQHAAELGLHVIDAGHFATEYPIVSELRAKLAAELTPLDEKIELIADETATDFFAVI